MDNSKVNKQNTKGKITQSFTGRVVSDKCNKTIVVRVERKIRHPRYGKLYVQHRRFKVHDKKEKFHVGDTVTFVSCRPISKDKKWRVLYN